MQTEWVVIGNPQNRRVVFFEEALRKFGQPAPTVVRYTDLIHGDSLQFWNLRVFRPRKRYVIRIESPGEDEQTERALIGFGYHELDRKTSGSLQCDFVTPGDLENLVYQKGRIRYPRQWYNGFRRFLHQLHERLDREQAVEFMNSPKDIAKMFAKSNCSVLFHDSGIPIPEAISNIQSYNSLVEHMLSSGRDRVFVKLDCGSSASGVVALEVNSKFQRAITSVELVGQNNKVQLFNSLQIRTYTDQAEISQIINWLLREGAHIEEWIPKAKIQGRNFDIRYVVIGDQCQHRVVRSSQYPMTNLHLGNQREPELPADSQIDEAVLRDICVDVKNVFPNSLYLGVDVCLRRSNLQPYVLEANAFGDLLPGIEYHGLSTYEAEVKQQLEQIREKTESFMPSSTKAPPTLLALRYDLIGLEWFSKARIEIDSKAYPDSFSEEVLLADAIRDGSVETRMIYSDWLQERGSATAAYAQRLGAQGAQWKELSMSSIGGMLTVSQIGLAFEGNVIAVLMRVPTGYRCWRNVSEDKQQYCGIRSSIEEAIELSYEGLERWLIA